jgi:transcriptional regulator with XRE-family HTH domain
MPTLEQIRAARALLGWSQSDLADLAGLSQTGIARIENGTNHPNLQTMAKIEQAFEDHDIEFIDTSGVRKRSGEIKTFRGTNGFRDFMEDVYNTANKIGGEICLFNARPIYWYRFLGTEWYVEHAKRMEQIRDKFVFKVTAEEGEDLLIGKSFAEYRWFPSTMFNERAFYAYGNKLAFLSFENENVQILVFENKEFTNAFRVLFNIGWDNVAIKIKE